MIYILSAPSSPVWGFIIDRFGYNVYCVLVAVVTTFGCLALLSFAYINPWVPVVSVMPAGFRHRDTLVTTTFFDILHVFRCS